MNLYNAETNKISGKNVNVMLDNQANKDMLVDTPNVNYHKDTINYKIEKTQGS